MINDTKTKEDRVAKLAIEASLLKQRIDNIASELSSLKQAPVPSQRLFKNQVREDNLYETIIEGTCSSSVGTETSHNHNLPGTPKKVVIVPTLGGVVYLTGTTATQIKVKSTVASTTFKAYCQL